MEFSLELTAKAFSFILHCLASWLHFLLTKTSRFSIIKVKYIMLQTLGRFFILLSPRMVPMQCRIYRLLIDGYWESFDSQHSHRIKNLKWSSNYNYLFKSLYPCFMVHFKSTFISSQSLTTQKIPYGDLIGRKYWIKSRRRKCLLSHMPKKEGLLLFFAN